MTDRDRFIEMLRSNGFTMVVHCFTIISFWKAFIDKDGFYCSTKSVEANFFYSGRFNDVVHDDYD